MRKLYLTSSPTGDYRSSEAPTYPGLNPANGMVDELKSDWKADARCLIIAATPDAYEINDEMVEFFKEKLVASGLPVKEMCLCDDRNGEEMVGALDTFDMLILGGGHVPTQNTFLKKIGLREKIQNFDGIIMGISAGTMNMADVVYAQPEMPGESTNPAYEKFIQGLGLTKKMVLPHYQAVKDDVLDGKRLYEEITYPDSVGHTFYVLVDGSYILQRDGIEKVCGEAYLIQDGAMRPYEEVE